LKFLADGMLGKLARWLRMLGHDVVYSVQLNDNELLELEKKEDRTLLTKDFELYKRAVGRGLDAFYVEGNVESDRLAEVAKRYGLQLIVDMENSHCPKCNTPLKAASKDLVSSQIEKNTYNHYDKFWKCPNCGQVYWQGAHWQQITKTLTQTQAKLKSKERNRA
jgi:uncharacterized protein